MESADVIVIGAGIAGLAAALEISETGRSVILIERDRIPSKQKKFQVKQTERRRGVPHESQPHFFMGRLHSLLRERWPDLLDSLLNAGIWYRPVFETMGPKARANYRARAIDAELLPLFARRPVFERVLRAYVLDRKNITLLDNSRCIDVATGCTGGVLAVDGCLIERVVDGVASRHWLRADFFVDASGRSSAIAKWIRAEGGSVEDEYHASKRIYLTRHYALKSGLDYPEMQGIPGRNFASAFVGVMPGNDHRFTVTIGTWRDASGCTRLLRDSERFEELCNQVPEIASWIDPARAEALGGVIGFASMDAVWRHTSGRSGARVTNLFFVGDSAICSNPKFGRGTTWAFLMAGFAAEAIVNAREHADPIHIYERALHRHFRRDWETMLALENDARLRFQCAIGRSSATLLRRAAWKFEDFVLCVAIKESAIVHRSITTAYNGFSGFSDWCRKPQVWFAIAKSAFADRRATDTENSMQRRKLEATILRFMVEPAASAEPVAERVREARIAA